MIGDFRNLIPHLFIRIEPDHHSDERILNCVDIIQEKRQGSIIESHLHKRLVIVVGQYSYVAFPAIIIQSCCSIWKD